LEKYKGVYVTSDPGVTTLGLKMNTQKGYTKDINIRKAINYAIDYDSMLKTLNGKAALEDSPFPSASRAMSRPMHTAWTWPRPRNT
jgi:peptide/nickel transport system substrate-binding protein